MKTSYIHRRISSVNRSSGFTLVELLVVMAIVSLLIAMLIPALRSAMETARRSRCLANLHSIGQGYGMYCNDNKGQTWTSSQSPAYDAWDATASLRLGYTVTPTHPSAILWVNEGKLIEGYYIENPDIFGCPSAPPQSQANVLTQYQSLPILNIGRSAATRYILPNNPPTYWSQDYYPRINKDTDLGANNNLYGNPLNFDRDAKKGILADNFRIGSTDNTFIAGRPYHINGDLPYGAFNTTTHLITSTNFGFNVLYLSGDAKFTNTAAGVTASNSGNFRTWYPNYVDRK